MRMSLLITRSSIIYSPAIPMMDRSLLQTNPGDTDYVMDNGVTDSTVMDTGVNGVPSVNIANTVTSLTFTVTRSGRVVRKISASPDYLTRDWILPTGTNIRENYGGLRQVGDLIILM